MDRMHRLPEFRHDYARIDRSLKDKSGKDSQQQRQKKRDSQPKEWFDNLADSIGQYQPESFQTYG